MCCNMTINNHYTSTIYTLIKDEEYSEAIFQLEIQLQKMPRSRAILSLLGYCYYQQNNFEQAASHYGTLTSVCPEVYEYRTYYAQCLIMIGSHEEAANALNKINSSVQNQQSNFLKAIVHFEQDNIEECRSCLEDCLVDNPDSFVAEAALLFKEGKIEEARDMYLEALGIQGYQADINYGLALCYYSLGNMHVATTYVDEIIEKSSKQYPNFKVDQSEQDNMINIGNSKVLEESFLIEAINLKAAIDYTDSKDSVKEAKQTFLIMPPRSDEELDAITLQNQAILNMDDDANTGYQKLNFLLANPPFPTETFGNLLLLYCQQGYHELAADILAQNAHLTMTLLTKDLYDFLDASIMLSTSAEEAYRKFDDLAKRGLDRLRKLSNSILQTKATSDENKMSVKCKEFEDEKERYIPILMAMAGVYWDKENYAQVERILRQSAEFCSDDETWRLNAAHVFFMSEEPKFNKAIAYYTPILNNVDKSDLLKIPAIVLANVCVSFIMTNQNNKAEEIIKDVENAENSYQKGEKRYYHGCIINLCIGTLYCEKKNFEFGISRVCKSFEPIEEKLNPDTWFYSKRCFLAFAENIAKHLSVISDYSLDEILSFLDAIIEHGKDLPSTIQRISISADKEPQATIAFEALALKQLYSKLL